MVCQCSQSDVRITNGTDLAVCLQHATTPQRFLQEQIVFYLVVWPGTESTIDHQMFHGIVHKINIYYSRPRLISQAAY